MIAIVLIASLTACLLLLSFLAAVEIRRRNVDTEQNELGTGEEGEGIVTRPPSRRAPASKSPIIVVLLVAAALLVLYLKKLITETAPRHQRTCSGPPSVDQRLKLMPDLLGFHHGIATTSAKAQALFDQGLLFAWNFDQPEALKCFEMAALLDPDSAMPAWGIQYAIGPGANRAAVPKQTPYPSFTPDQFARVQKAAGKAKELAEQALQNPTSSFHARDLAFANAAKLRWPPASQSGEARNLAEAQYASALRQFGEEKKDAAALAMAAEAMMNLNPWEYYLPNGSMKPSAQQAEDLIQASLALDPQNPLANHLAIHITEASSTLRTAGLSAARGEAAANRLHFSNGPWNVEQGHLLHMPSHTFIRLGRYHDAAVANVKAFNADLKLAQNCMEPYEPEHNTDMLIFTASMAGQFTLAKEFALRIREFGSLMFPDVEARQTVNWAKYPLLLVHFGKWNDIFKLEAPGPDDRANCPSGGPQFVQVIWRFARIMALAARADGYKLSEETENFVKLDSYLDTYLQQLEVAAQQVVPEEQTVPPAIYLCEHKGLSDIYVLLAKARVSYLRGNVKDTIAQLKAAVAIEDDFLYMEPPRVYQPVRQCLGHILLEENNLSEAEQVFAEDLVNYPENGWSLHGLSATFHEAGNHAEVARIRTRLESAWGQAQENIECSCLSFCRAWGNPK